MNGAADVAVTAVVAIVLLAVAGRILFWLADRMVNAIDFMTRHE